MEAVWPELFVKEGEDNVVRDNVVVVVIEIGWHGLLADMSCFVCWVRMENRVDEYLGRLVKGAVGRIMIGGIILHSVALVRKFDGWSQ